MSARLALARTVAPSTSAPSESFGSPYADPRL